VATNSFPKFEEDYSYDTKKTSMPHNSYHPASQTPPFAFGSASPGSFVNSGFVPVSASYHGGRDIVKICKVEANL